MSDAIDPINEEFVTYTVSKRDGLVRHIEHLERTLAKRNARIAELEQRLDGESESEKMQRARQAGYTRGWTDALNATAAAHDQAMRALATARHATIVTLTHGPRDQEQA